MMLGDPMGAKSGFLKICEQQVIQSMFLSS